MSSKPQSFDDRHYRLLIVVAVVIGAGLRLAIMPRFDFYGDEFWTLKWSQASVGEIFATFGKGLTMHLYILFAKAWIGLVGFSPFLVKLPSLIAGVVLIPLVFWFGRRWLDSDSAALAAVMTALNLQMIVHSRTARVYVILAVVVLLSMFLFSRFLRTGSKRDLFLGVSMSFVLLTLSVHSIYILIIQSLFLAFELISARRWSRRRLMTWAGGISVSLALAAVFYHRAMSGLGKVLDATGITGAKVVDAKGATVASKLFDSPWMLDQKLWFPFSASHLIVPWLMLAALILGSWIAWRRQPLTGRLLVLWAFLPSLLYFFQRDQIPGGSIVRYVLPALPAQLLLIALGALFFLRRLIPGSRPRWALSSAILLFVTATFLDQEYQRGLVRQMEPTRQATLQILDNVGPGDLVTSFPDHYHELLKFYFGAAAVRLPVIIYDRSMRRSGKLVLMMQAQPEAVAWWERTFEIEEIGDRFYSRRLLLLTSKTIGPGDDALREPLEQFYYGLLSIAANGGKLYLNNPAAHYRDLSRVHVRLAQLALEAGEIEELEEHERLKSNPRAWDGDMSGYPRIMAKLSSADVEEGPTAD